MSTSEPALVIFSGGQDSTTCLLQAVAERGAKQVQAISFLYGQRHAIEMACAEAIVRTLGVKQTIMDLSLMGQITHNALMDEQAAIQQEAGSPPNTMVDGRNALFLMYAAIYAKSQGIRQIVIGVSEADFSGYPDCRDIFIKSMNVTLNLAMAYDFQLLTPLMHLNKAQVWGLADDLDYLDFVREQTHTCYLGVKGGCGTCPSCVLRENGLRAYLASRDNA